MKNNVQKFGKFLSAMVMPNIGALIAFGFLAAAGGSDGTCSVAHRGHKALVVHCGDIGIATRPRHRSGGSAGRNCDRIGVLLADGDVLLVERQ